MVEGKIHGKIAKTILELVFEKDKDPRVIMTEQGLEQMNDSGELDKLVSQVLSENPVAVEQIKAGDTKPMGFLMGQVMKASGGRAEPGLVQKMLKEHLG
jgi:aspartyl-tRNA(Asn)/glutamyl-tRNA(Gln) amidotransferase subunit B